MLFVLAIAIPAIVIIARQTGKSPELTTPENFVRDLMHARHEANGSYHTYARKLSLYTDALNDKPWLDIKALVSKPPFRIEEDYDQTLIVTVDGAEIIAPPSFRFRPVIRLFRSTKREHTTTFRTTARAELVGKFVPKDFAPEADPHTFLSRLANRGPFRRIAKNYPDEGEIAFSYARSRSQSSLYTGKLFATVRLTRVTGAQRDSTKLEYEAKSELELGERRIVNFLPFHWSRSLDKVEHVAAVVERDIVLESNARSGDLIRHGYTHPPTVEINENVMRTYGDIKAISKRIRSINTVFENRWLPTGADKEFAQFTELEEAHIYQLQFVPLLESKTTLRHLIYTGEPFQLARLRRLTKLRTLTLSFNKSPTDDQVAGIASLPGLESLGLYGYVPGPKSLRAIASMPNLKELTLVGRQIPIEHLRALSRLPSLERLTINADLSQPGDSGVLTQFPKLRGLVLSMCKVHPDAIKKLAAKGQLRELWLMQIKNLKAADLDCLSALPNLDRLMVNNSGSITINDLAALKPKLKGTFDGP